MHAHHSGVQFIGPVKCPLSHEGVPYRGVDLPGKQAHLLGRVRQIGASSYQDKRLLRILDHHQSQLQVFLLDGVGLSRRLLRSLVFVIIGIAGHILGDVHQNRAGAA